jgi:hypothetical protein
MMAFYKALAHIKLWEKQEFRGDPVPARYGKIRAEILSVWKAPDP